MGYVGKQAYEIHCNALPILCNIPLGSLFVESLSHPSGTLRHRAPAFCHAISVQPSATSVRPSLSEGGSAARVYAWQLTAQCQIFSQGWRGDGSLGLNHNPHSIWKLAAQKMAPELQPWSGEATTSAYLFQILNRKNPFQWGPLGGGNRQKQSRRDIANYRQGIAKSLMGLHFDRA